MKALVVRAGALGDLLVLRPSIAALQRAGYEVDLLAPLGPAAALVGRGPGDVAEVLDWEAPSLAGLSTDRGVDESAIASRVRGYDACVAYTRDATLIANLRRLIPRTTACDPRPEPGIHATDWLASAMPAIDVVVPSMAVAPIDPGPDARRVALGITAPLPDRFVAIHPGSGSVRKNWPAARFAALARSLASESWLLVRGPADDVASAPLADVPGVVVARDLPLRVLAAVFARAGAYVGNDSGITHLAAAAGAPTIALFGATDARTWAPRGPHVRVIDCGADMAGVPVDEVRAALDERRAVT